MYDLENYLRKELAEGKIDFTFRARIDAENRVRFYAHPQGRAGDTTPEIAVLGNVIRLVR